MQTQTEQPATFSEYSEAERKVLLQLAVDHENAQHKQPTIHIIRADGLTHFLATHQREERIQLVVEKEGHYFALDLLQQDDHKSCIVLDAANDEKSKEITTELETQGFTVLRASGLDKDQYANSNLQTDSTNSALFALDHSIQLANAPNDLHTTVQTNASAGSFTWDILPPNFLRNAQEFDFLEQYMEKHASELDVATKQYIQTGLKEYDEGGEISTQNDAITMHVFLNAQRLYQKEKIIEAMTQAIQESDHSWKIFDKSAKKIELTRIKHEFADAEVNEDPFSSPSVLAFDAEVEQTHWRNPNLKATTEYRSHMQGLRTEQSAEQTPAMGL